MKLKDIKIGMKLKINNPNCGCEDSPDKCVNCPEFKKGIEVKKINLTNPKIILGISLIDNYTSCDFNPEDLSPIEITNWRKEFEP